MPLERVYLIKKMSLIFFLSLISIAVGSSTTIPPAPAPAPINGGWSDWVNWPACHGADCGKIGTQTRGRSCTNPVTKHGGIPCAGLTSDARSCTVTCNSKRPIRPVLSLDIVHTCVCKGCDVKAVTLMGVVSIYNNTYECYYLRHNGKVDNHLRIPVQNAVDLLELLTLDHNKYYRTDNDKLLGRGYVQLYPTIIPDLTAYKNFIAILPNAFSASNLPSPNRVDIMCLYWYMSPSGPLIHDCHIPIKSPFFHFEISLNSSDAYNKALSKVETYEKTAKPPILPQPLKSNAAPIIIPTILTFLSMFFIIM